MNVVQAFDQLILQCYKKVDRRVKWHGGYQIYFYLMEVLVCFCVFYFKNLFIFLLQIVRN